jgi:hypothetical protein
MRRRWLSSGAYPPPWPSPVVAFKCTFAKVSDTIAQCQVCKMLGKQGTEALCKGATIFRLGGQEYLKTGWFKPKEQEYERHSPAD